MKAAIIGGGFAAGIHAEALRACGAGIGAVMTTREETARRFGETWHAERWGTDLDLVLRDDIDAVHICTPPTSHAFYVKAALEAGKRVFCEKPLCFSSREGRKLAAIAERSGISCTTSFNVRYHMAVQRARELLQSGAFGRPLLIHGSYLQEFHVLPAPYDWRYRADLAGSMRAVTEIGSHWIDTAQYISGRRVTAVSAFFGNYFPERIVENGTMRKPLPGEEGGQRIRVDSEDAACLMLRYEDGAMGTLMLSEISPGRGNRLALEITCENGSLWWNEEENNVLHTAVKGEGVRSEIFAFGNGFSDTFASLMRSFYEGKEVPTFREGAQVAAVCEAIERSARQESGWTEVEDAT